MFDHNPTDRRIQQNRAAVAFKSFRHRLSQHPRTAAWVFRAALVQHRMPAREIAGANLVRRRARLRRQPAHRRPHRFAFKGFRNQMPIRCEQAPQNIHWVSAAFALELAGQHLATQVGGRWRAQKHAEHAFVERPPHLDEITICLGITRRNLLDGRAGFVQVAPKLNRARIVGQRKPGERIHFDVFEAKTVQFQLANHGREMDHNVRRRANIHPIAAEHIFGTHRAADDWSPLDHQCLHTRFLQIAGAGQAVMPAANDNRVICLSHEKYSFVPKIA